MRTVLLIYIVLMIGKGSWGSTDQNLTVTETPLEESGFQGEGGAGRTNRADIRDKDFNFHSKENFLKKTVRDLVTCIQNSLPGPLPNPETLLMSNESNPDGRLRFVFKYNGTRQYNESCLGDGYKKDLLYRLYDCGKWSYEQKIEYLNNFSCDATKYLECRHVGEETERAYAEQATPIMRCMCPNYDKPQTRFEDGGRGFYSPEMEKCVLKAGQKCTFEAKGLDKRSTWNDTDFVDNTTGTTWIEVADLRPLGYTYECVNNAFCYTTNNRGLTLEDAYKNRCVCIHKHFQTHDGSCTNVLEDAPQGGLFMALAFIIIAITVFLTGITNR